ncbi:MAG: protein adenylyltransferase SelO [Labrys sp. (in: a-proteobacteria)]|jgi:uncharacterized protein YdiU (UPF0061 family)
MTLHFPFDNSYARMPAGFFAHVRPHAATAPALIALNVPLARQLGLDPEALAGPEGVAVLSGAAVPDGAQPIALAYAGHQFGQFVPQLGDGRAILLGEIVDRDGNRRDIQLKGAGQTPYSRRGDGRAALGPVLREYIVSEAMAALGVPTTRALAAVTTGEAVIRETILPGAVVTRVAASHIRVGTFQFFAARGQTDALAALLDHAIARHYPDVTESDDRALAFLDAVIERQAHLIARWLTIGFIHGVMNTDNMAISGETIDYGPCAFMDAYDPAKVFSSIDQFGRYAYANQPRIAQWNLARLAETLLPLMPGEPDAALRRAEEAVGHFAPRFQAAYSAGMRAKIGLADTADEDDALVQDLLDRMAANAADFTLTFRGLCAAAEDASADETVRVLFKEPAFYDEWAVRWHARLARETVSATERRARMETVNPAIIPRNHRIEEVIEAAVNENDFAPFHRLNAALADPFADDPRHIAFCAPPTESERVLRTFCGT